MTPDAVGGLSASDLDVVIDAAHPSRPDREELTRHHVERILAAHTDDLRAEVERLREQWSACWCGPQQGPDDDPRVSDCPQHGTADCRHMAEGIVTHLTAALAHSTGGPQ